MPHLYAYFDEGGKHSEHPIVAFSGLVDGFESWRALQEKWLGLLRRFHIEHFHAAKGMRYSQPYGDMKAGTAAERTADIRPFVREITEGIALGIAIAVDVKAYESASHILHGAYGRDPHYFAFFLAMNELLGYYAIPKHLTVGLILDDEEKKAIECYKLLKRMKLANPEVRERVASICFIDDRRAAQLQAADLFAYLTRSEAQQRFSGKRYPYHDLFIAFQEVSPATGNHLHFAGGFYDAPALAAFLKQHLLSIE